MSKPLCFWVCAHYRDEVAAVLAREAWPDVTLQTHPPLCNHHLAAARAEATPLSLPQGDYDQIYLISGCLPMRANMAGVPTNWKINEVQQCFHLLAAPEWVDQLLRRGAYLVSPGWLSHWSQHIARWGFDQATAQDFFRESMRQIVLLDTGLDPGSPAQAEALANHVDLPVQVWQIGLSYLQKTLLALYREWQVAQAQSSTRRQTADYAMAFDWLPHLAALQMESEVTEALTDFFTMLFAPRRASYRPIGANSAEAVAPAHPLVTPEPALEAWLAAPEPFLWTADSLGFLLRLTHQADTVGVVEIDGLAFPAFREHYLRLALALAPVGGLAIANARAYQAIRRLNAGLEQRVRDRTAELSQANAALTRALRVKDEFSAAMSRELRTPLSSIMSMADTLQMGVYGPLTERQLKPMALLYANAERLLNLVTDVLDYTALEAGSFRLHLSETPVLEVCQAGLQTIQTLAQKKKLQVSCSLPPDTLTVLADRPSLEKILAKLLDNAVKFTPEGGQVGLEVAADPAREEVCFAVWDTGIGITPQDQVRLFEPFEQADRRLARGYEGAGLGLALVRRLAELHGGRVTVHSAGAGQGSRFSVGLPCRMPGRP